MYYSTVSKNPCKLPTSVVAKVNKCGITNFLPIDLNGLILSTKRSNLTNPLRIKKKR